MWQWQSFEIGKLAKLELYLRLLAVVNRSETIQEYGKQTWGSYYRSAAGPNQVETQWKSPWSAVKISYRLLRLLRIRLCDCSTFPIHSPIINQLQSYLVNWQFCLLTLTYYLLLVNNLDALVKRHSLAFGWWELFRLLWLDEWITRRWRNPATRWWKVMAKSFTIL